MPRKAKTTVTENVETNEVKEEAVNETVVNNDVQREKIRNLVKTVYDIQKLRIATGNRVVQSFNIQMGQAPSTKQEDMDSEAQKMIQTLHKEYNRITDGYINKSYSVSKKTSVKSDDDDGKTVQAEVELVKLGAKDSLHKVIDKMSADKDAGIKFIKSDLDYKMVGTYVQLLNTEEETIKILAKEVEQHPMWDAFFKDVAGCGPLMSAICISYFDIYKSRHVSSFWKYAGLDVVQVEDGVDEDGIPKYHGEGRSKRHIEMVNYIDKNGNTCQKRSITYNPELKTKLLGVLGSNFIKQGKKSKYEQIYRDMRARLAQRPDLKAEYDADGNEIDRNKGRRHYMANRYMVKMFVRDMWVAWRTVEELPISAPYEVDKLGRKPHKYNEAQVIAAERSRLA